ncbi:hypothetical protein [Streptomyces sp. NPDC005548]|uniref:hypothetical protein n=1 Tax=Streptomyces sp. NPDC005548 TaxID=3364724 RepID=UPI003681659C
MTTNDMSAPQAVDYSGRPLVVDDPVAFLTSDPIGLAHGHIRIVGPNDLCIDTGEHLVTFPALPAGFGVPLLSPIGGKAKPYPVPDGAQRYPHVALQPPRDDV